MNKSIGQIQRKNVFRALLIFFIACSFIKAQIKENVVAKAGSIEITEYEFKKRFEFTPHPDKSGLFDSSEIKRKFLLTLMSEKLLAQQAILKGLDKSKDFLIQYEFIKSLYLRDALYQVEIKNKVVVPDSAYIDAKNKIKKTISLKYIFGTDELEINQIYQNLSSPAAFDSLLSLRPENYEQKNAAEVDFGKMNEKVEEIVFNLNPNEISKPIQMQEGWYIFKVYSVVQKNFFEESDLKNIDRIIKERQENKQYEKFYKAFFKNLIINADKKLFDELSVQIFSFIHSNEKSFVLRNGKYSLYEAEINAIRESISGELLSSIFIKFNNEPISLNSFLDHMILEGFEFVNMDLKRVKSRLNTYISTYIQNELLAREAKKRGYEELPSVAFELKTWKENYLANLLMKKYYKNESVSDDEAYDFYARNNKIIRQYDEIKIAEILTGDLDTVQKIFEELNKGVDFKEVARKYTIRDSLKSKDCEFDYQPINKSGEIWRFASNLQVDEVYGPIKTEEGYSIIKLIDRKFGKEMMFNSFDEAKNDIKEILKTERMYEKLENEVSKLALDYRLEINEKLLSALKINNVNMIVYKRFGFGGQHLAVPYTPDFSDWYSKYEKLLKSLLF